MEYFKEYFQFLIKFKTNNDVHEKQFNDLKKMLLSAQKENKLSFMSYLIEKHIDDLTIMRFDVMSIFEVVSTANYVLLHSSIAYEISTLVPFNNNLGFESVTIYDEYGRW